MRKLLGLFMVISLLLAGSIGAYAEQITLHMWGHSNAFFEQANRDIIAAYEALNPNVKIIYETFPYDTFLQKSLTSFSVGEQPDILEMSGRLIMSYAKNGLIEPVPAELMTTEEMEEAFFEGAIGGYKHNGVYYAMPRESNFEYGGILANMEILRSVGVETLPTTWDELIEAAKKATIKRGNLISRHGFYLGGGDATVYYLLAFILQNGGEYWNEDQTAVNFTTPEAKKALQEIVNLTAAHQVMARETTAPTDIFVQQRAAMVAIGSWAISFVKSEYPELEIAYFPTPSVTDADPNYASQSGWGLVVSKDTPHQDVAWDFVKFATSTEQARHFLKTTMNIPPNKALMSDPELLEVNPYLEVPFKMMPYGRPLGDLRNAQQFVRIIMDAVDAAALGQISIDQALQNIEAEINQMIAEADGR